MVKTGVLGVVGSGGEWRRVVGVVGAAGGATNLAGRGAGSGRACENPPPCRPESHSHAQLVCGCQAGTQRVPLVQNHSQPMDAQQRGRDPTALLHSQPDPLPRRPLRPPPASTQLVGDVCLICLSLPPSFDPPPAPISRSNFSNSLHHFSLLSFLSWFHTFPCPCTLLSFLFLPLVLTLFLLSLLLLVLCITPHTLTPKPLTLTRPIPLLPPPSHLSILPSPPLHTQPAKRGYHHIIIPRQAVDSWRLLIGPVIHKHAQSPRCHVAGDLRQPMADERGGDHNQSGRRDEMVIPNDHHDCTVHP
ncbi:unnamed protein product [Closterium sp. NIES-54]